LAQSFFFTKLLGDGGEGTYNYAGVKRWSKQVHGKDIFALDKIIIPCNCNNMHWTCLVVYVKEKVSERALTKNSYRRLHPPLN
jgi:Ulp1 family protease